MGDHERFTREDFEKLGLIITKDEVAQEWRGFTEEELALLRSNAPEIATIKTKDAKLVGLEVSLPLVLTAGATEAAIDIEFSDGVKATIAGRKNPVIKISDYEDWFDPQNPDQEAKEKIARLYLVDLNGSAELRQKTEGGRMGVYKNPGSATNLHLFAGTPWLAEGPKMTIQTFKTLPEAKEGEAGGVVLKKEPIKTFKTDFQVSVG